MTKATKIGILIAIILALVGIGLIFPSFFPWLMSVLKAVWSMIKQIPSLLSKLVHSRVFWGIVCLGVGAGVFTVFYKGGNNNG